MSKRPKPKRPAKKGENPADDTRRNRLKTRRDIADLNARLIGLDTRIGQLEREARPILDTWATRSGLDLPVNKP